MAEIVWLLEEATSQFINARLLSTAGAEVYEITGCLIRCSQTAIVTLQPAPDLPSLAASYAYGIARNHPFIDGNKRTALVAARTFLLLNGVNVQAAQVDKWLTFLRLAEGSITERALGEWIRSRMVEEN